MSEDVKQELSALSSKFPNIDIRSARWDENGQLTLSVGLQGGPQDADTPPGVEVLQAAPAEAPGNLLGSVQPLYSARGGLRRIEIDPLTRDYLDLARSSVLNTKPQELYRRSIDYYHTRDVYGTAINVLTNFAAKGFENDIDDQTIKNFYDNWVIDVGFDAFVEQVFFDFFRVGLVRTYKVLGPYIPKINQLNSVPGKKTPRVRQPGKKTTGVPRIPIAYTILNPTAVDIQGTLLFGQTATYLKAAAGKELKEILELDRRKLTQVQRNIIDNLPRDFKRAVKESQDIPLDPELVGEIDYRRMPYERYPFPRGSRSFEALEFKDELRKADYSTLDGITNYILKITVGNDTYPVTRQDLLERVGEMFETVSKSYKVVWNHTLNVEKITTPEVGDILGDAKYRQVNGDMTAGLGVMRAFLDGTGDATAPGAELAVKAMTEEIAYARRQVQRWIYAEYRAVAESMGFPRFPLVRFDDMALRDELAMMAVVQGMIDRRIISYRTGQKKLGYDPSTELSQLETERPLVLSGVLGLAGSPYQQSRGGGEAAPEVQPTQRTPKGTPSEGRPKAKGPGKTPADKDKTKAPKATTEAAVAALSGLSLEELEQLLVEVRGKKA